MTASNPVSDPAAAAIGSALLEASDQKVLEIVSLLDALPDRQAIDTVIAPLRPRIANLRPVRPLTAQRLMFTPLDPVIVPTERWEPATGTVPRSIIAPLFAHLRPFVGDTDTLDRQARGLAPEDQDGRNRLGAGLWATAAKHLSRLDADGEWGGLGKGDRQGVIGSVHLVLSHAGRLRSLPGVAARQGMRAAGPELRETVLGMLEEAARNGLDAWTMMLNLLLDPVGGLAAVAPGPCVEITLECATEIAYSRAEARILKLLEGGTSRALNRLLDILATMAGHGQDQVPRNSEWLLGQIGRMGGMLDALAASPALRPQHHARLREVRHDAAAVCRQRFDATMQHGIVAGMRRLAAGGDAKLDPAALEDQARGLRALRARLHALGPQADSEDWRSEIIALLTARETPPALPDPEPRAATLLRNPPPQVDAEMVRFLRLSEIMLGSADAAGMAGQAGWQT